MADWQAIVSQHGETAWKTAYRLLGNHADAADCVQEAFLSALALSRRQTVANWGGLLVTLTTRKAIDCLRQRSSQGIRPVQLPALADIPGGRASPSQEAESVELGESLRLALAKLPPRHAEVFCLRFLNDLTYDQIAHEIGIEANHVGVLLHRAREQLRTFMSRAHAADEGGGKP